MAETDVFDSDFAEVYSKTTGEKQAVPRDWLDDDVLGSDFSLTPTAAARDAIDIEHGTPDQAWTIPQLRQRAELDGVDLTGLSLKAELLEAVLAGPAPTDTTTTPPNPSDTDTPGTGDEE